MQGNLRYLKSSNLNVNLVSTVSTVCIVSIAGIVSIVIVYWHS